MGREPLLVKREMPRRKTPRQAELVPAKSASGQKGALNYKLQRSDLLTAGTADAVPIVCYRVRVHFAAEVARTGGAILLEQNGISIHKNLELGTGIQPQTVPELFRQYDTT
jgi:hypothetical protein